MKIYVHLISYVNSDKTDVFHIRRGAKTRRLLIHVTGLSADRLFHHAVRRDSFTAGSRSTEKAWASSATLSDWNRNSSSVPPQTEWHGDVWEK